ncbi:MAG: hypothetical protein Q9191_007707, partial [Dirinaria sp. TL-2023a]
SAPVLGAEPRHAADGPVDDLDRRVRLAHEAVPDQVDAVPDMRRAVHHGDVLVDDLFARDGGGV